MTDEFHYNILVEYNNKCNSLIGVCQNQVLTVVVHSIVFRLRLNSRSSLVTGGKSSSIGGLSSPAPSSLLSHGVYQSNHHHHHQQQQPQLRQQGGGGHLLPFLDRPGSSIEIMSIAFACFFMGNIEHVSWQMPPYSWYKLYDNKLIRLILNSK